MDICLSVVAFKRAKYLKEVLCGVRGRGFKYYLFRDGRRGLDGVERAGMDELGEIWDVWDKEMFLEDAEFYSSKDNLGVARNSFWALEVPFRDGAKVVYLFEEDIVPLEGYFEKVLPEPGKVVVARDEETLMASFVVLAVDWWRWRPAYKEYIEWVSQWDYDKIPRGLSCKEWGCETQDGVKRRLVEESGLEVKDVWGCVKHIGKIGLHYGNSNARV